MPNETDIVPITRGQLKRLAKMLEVFESSGIDFSNKRPRDYQSFESGQFRKVYIEPAGGAAGSSSTVCSFTYKMKNAAGAYLANSNTTPVQPKWGRKSFGKKLAAANNSIGLASIELVSGTPTLTLLMVDEEPNRRTC